MKKTTLFISILLISTFSFAQFENFEDWTQPSVLNLDNYRTNIDEYGQLGESAVLRVTDAVTGTYAIQLKVITNPTTADTISGYITSGDPEEQTPGQAVTLPFPGAVDSLIGWYKYAIMPNDSSVIVAGTSTLGTITGGGIFYIKGAQTTWKRFAYPINAIGSDSLLFAVSLGDPLNNFKGVPGSWIQYDDIQMKSALGTMNLVNHSFENWTTTSSDKLDGWNTSNDFVFNEPLMPAVKSTTAHSGSFALELNTILNSNNDTIKGVATNGSFNQNGITGGAPYTAKPSSIEFYYKNTFSEVDTSYLILEFKNGGTTFYQSGAQLTQTSTYTLSTQALSLAMTPDSVLISILGGDHPGSQLTIDDIAFLFPVGIAEGLTVEKIVAYPNPVTDVLKIKFNITNNNQVSIRLIDVLGKELTNRSLGNISSGTYRESFNTSNFANGVYFVEFTLGNEKIVERFIVK